jgi:Mlc titration factor MtfA (ptsG expression regulator)
MIGKLFDWLRPQQAAIPDGLWQQVVADLPFLDGLSADELARLRALTQDFLADKEFSAAGGLELSDEMCVSIAVQGCLPILELGLASYRGWRGVIVYPNEFVIPRQIADEFGVVHEYDEVASGEAWSGGPLLISWRDAQMAGDGYNVVIHEFAHKLDMQNGDVDGMPALPAEIARDEWHAVMLAAYEDFCREVELAERRREDTEIDPYAAEHPAEFFAVLSEAFFETPEIVVARFPDLYALFSRYYRQDPLARRDSAPAVSSAP